MGDEISNGEDSPPMEQDEDQKMRMVVVKVCNCLIIPLIFVKMM